MMDKKADLTITVVVVAVLALLVLIVLALVFTGRLGIFAAKTGDCTVAGGRCVAAASECGQFERADVGYKCPAVIPAEDTCCIGINTATP